MTGQELLTYKMNKEEQVVWYRFCVDIKKRLEELKLEPYAYQVLLDELTKETPYTYMGGYAEGDGYYYVTAGDRGDWTLVFKAKECKEAWDRMLKYLADRIAYKCVGKRMDDIELEHRHLWRYYKVYVGREANRTIYRDEENETWQYDAKYDYRKYWFEMALYIMKATVSDEMFYEEVERYEKLLNLWHDSPYWVYNVAQKEFVPCR